MIYIGNTEMQSFNNGVGGIQKILFGREVVYDRGEGYNVIIPHGMEITNLFAKGLKILKTSDGKILRTNETGV